MDLYEQAQQVRDESSFADFVRAMTEVLEAERASSDSTNTETVEILTEAAKKWAAKQCRYTENSWREFALYLYSGKS
jgi:hypothetical protein